jgi:hypothetical protein
MTSLCSLTATLLIQRRVRVRDGDMLDRLLAGDPAAWGGLFVALLVGAALVYVALKLRSEAPGDVAYETRRHGRGRAMIRVAVRECRNRHIRFGVFLASFATIGAAIVFVPALFEIGVKAPGGVIVSVVAVVWVAALSLAVRKIRRGRAVAEGDKHPLWRLVTETPEAAQSVEFLQFKRAGKVMTSFAIRSDDECWEFTLPAQSAQALIDELPALFPAAVGDRSVAYDSVA